MFLADAPCQHAVCDVKKSCIVTVFRRGRIFGGITQQPLHSLLLASVRHSSRPLIEPALALLRHRGMQLESAGPCTHKRAAFPCAPSDSLPVKDHSFLCIPSYSLSLLMRRASIHPYPCARRKTICAFAWLVHVLGRFGSKNRVPLLPSFFCGSKL